MVLTKVKELLTTKEFTVEVYSEEVGSTAVGYLKYNIPTAELTSVREYEQGRHVIKGRCSNKDYKLLKGIIDIKIL